MNNLSIKIKAYILVFLGALTAIILSYVSTLGLKQIEKELSFLELATNVERYAYKTILEEKIYLLNANGATSNRIKADEAFQRAKDNVKTISETLDTIDSSNGSEALLSNIKNSTKRYQYL